MTESLSYFPHRVARGNALAGNGEVPVHASANMGSWHRTLCGIKLWGPLGLAAETQVTCQRCRRHIP